MKNQSNKIFAKTSGNYPKEGFILLNILIYYIIFYIKYFSKEIAKKLLLIQINNI